MTIENKPTFTLICPAAYGYEQMALAWLLCTRPSDLTQRKVEHAGDNGSMRWIINVWVDSAPDI